MSATPPPSVASRQPGALLRSFVPFDRLSEETAAKLEPLLQARRYRLGQTLMRPDVMPEGLLFLVRGALRSLGPDPVGQGLRTLERPASGSLHGWAGLLRGQPCEHLRATEEVEALLLPAAAFADLLQGHPTLTQWFQEALNLPELHTLLLALSLIHI